MKYMPSCPRHVSRFGLYACLLSAVSLAGCSRTIPTLLAAGPDLEFAGKVESGGAGLPVRCKSGKPLETYAWVARLTQHDFDARLELRTQDGAILESIASPARGGGHEYLYREPLRGEVASLHVIAAQEPVASSATYRVEVFCLRQAPSAEVASAWRSLGSAAAAVRASDPVLRDSAVTQLASAEATWARLGETQLAADAALQLAGLQYYERQDWQPALEAARRAVRLADAAGDLALRADARLLEGAVALELVRSGVKVDADAPAEGERTVNTVVGSTAPIADGPWRGAIAALNDARGLYQQANAPASAAQVLLYLAGSHYDRGEFDAAVAGFESAAAALRELGATQDQLLAESNLAAVQFDRGDFAGAARVWEDLLLRLPPSDAEGRALSLQNLAGAISATGDSERALSAYRESLEIATQIGDDDMLSRALSGLGNNHARLGHHDLAITYMRDAIAIRRRLGHLDAAALSLAQLGDVYLQSGDLQRARASHRAALELIGSAAAPALRARLLLALGGDQALAGQHALAIGTYSGALELLSTQSNGLALRLLVGRATSRRLIDDLGDAYADASHAATLARAGADRETLIAALIEIARIELQKGDEAEALSGAAAAVAEVERLPAGAANPDNRFTLRARMREPYDLRVDLLAQKAGRAKAQGDVAAANVSAIEALRATLQTSARSSRPMSGQRLATDPPAEAYALLATRRYRLEMLTERGDTASPTFRALEREVALLRTRLATGSESSLVSRDLRMREEPDLARDVVEEGSHRLPVPGLQLPSDVAVLTYWLGASQSWVWVITRSGVQLHRLPAKETIDAGVARLLKLIRSPASGPAESRAVVAELERLVLPPNIEVGAPHWRVVPDGSLGAVPWALLAQRRGLETASLLPSAASLFSSLLSDGTVERVRRPRIAMFGDPVFSSADRRLSGSNAERSLSAAMIPFPEADQRNLARLSGTALELNSIAKLAGDAVVLQATGFEASRDVFLDLPSRRPDVLHMATHAVIDSDVPELAALVLSRFDSNGHRQQGSLRARDILALASTPPLVVLSACDAAAEPGGVSDGRMTLVRAFLARGSREVIASLWETSDAAAIELMTRFYEGIYDQGLEPEAALFRAQSALADTARWAAPYYWAGFVLTRASP